MTHRNRIRSGARALNTTIRKVVAKRYEHGASTRIRHVRAHTHGKDVHSRMNERADRLANGAREASTDAGPPFMINDERVLFFAPVRGTSGPRTYVSGDLRKTLKRIARGGQQNRWAECTGRQGQFPRHVLTTSWGFVSLSVSCVTQCCKDLQYWRPCVNCPQ
jgi:hypothetical protein